MHVKAEILQTEPIETCYLVPLPESEHFVLHLKTQEGDDRQFHIHRDALLIQNRVIAGNTQANEGQSFEQALLAVLRDLERHGREIERHLLELVIDTKHRKKE